MAIAEPFTFRGQPCSNFAATSSLAERTVIKEIQAVPIPEDVPLESACLIACGVLTGAGSVWNAARSSAATPPWCSGSAAWGCRRSRRCASPAPRASSPSTPRRPRARSALELGATDFLDVSTVESAGAIRAVFPFSDTAVTGPFGAGGVDWTFERTGHPPCCARRSTCWSGAGRPWLGCPGPGTEVGAPVNHMVHLDRTLMGVRYGEAAPRHPDDHRLLRPRPVPPRRDGHEAYPIADWQQALDDLHHGKLARGVL